MLGLISCFSSIRRATSQFSSNISGKAIWSRSQRFRWMMGSLSLLALSKNLPLQHSMELHLIRYILQRFSALKTLVLEKIYTESWFFYRLIKSKKNPKKGPRKVPDNLREILEKSQENTRKNPRKCPRKIPEKSHPEKIPGKVLEQSRQKSWETKG